MKILLITKVLDIERKLKGLEISREIINTIKRVVFETINLKLYDIYDLEFELEPRVNLRNHRDIKLVKTTKRRIKLVSEPNYHTAF